MGACPLRQVGGDESAVRRVRVLRLETLRDIEALLRERPAARRRRCHVNERMIAWRRVRAGGLWGQAWAGRLMVWVMCSQTVKRRVISRRCWAAVIR